jgi:hypothetical protein
MPAVKKLIAVNWVPIESVDIGNLDIVDPDFEKSRIIVCLIAQEHCRRL